jgi:cellulose synthase/poly-beta-1,6-N-acetylglucosamine synthase-like glycosyltransferase
VLEDLSCQSVPPDFKWELIVVDNNSNDETRTVVEACSKLAPMPVRYIFESRQGKSYALNTGIEATEFELLAFTDDDVRIGRDSYAGSQRWTGGGAFSTSCRPICRSAQGRKAIPRSTGFRL